LHSTCRHPPEITKVHFILPLCFLGLEGHGLGLDFGVVALLNITVLNVAYLVTLDFGVVALLTSLFLM